MNIMAVGINLAKNIFAVHDVNESGKAALVKKSCTCNLTSHIKIQFCYSLAGRFAPTYRVR